MANQLLDMEGAALSWPHPNVNTHPHSLRDPLRNEGTSELCLLLKTPPFLPTSGKQRWEGPSGREEGPWSRHQGPSSACALPQGPMEELVGLREGSSGNPVALRGALGPMSRSAEASEVRAGLPTPDPLWESSR